MSALPPLADIGRCRWGCPKGATCRHRQVGYRSNFPNTLCLEASEAGVLAKRSQHRAANLLAGPGWKGETPPSIKQVIRSETQFVFVFYRTQPNLRVE
jgi:Protein of unknown function (DUF1254)